MAATTSSRRHMDGPLTIQEMAGRSGFSEPTLRYYERIGLLGSVRRDRSSGHRRYDMATVERIDALACLRSSGLGVEEMRRYLRLLDEGDRAAAEQRDLFAEHAERLSAEIERLRVRQQYMRAKAQMWDARVRQDSVAESRATQEVRDTIEKF